MLFQGGTVPAEKDSELAIISAVVSAVMLATFQLHLIVSLQLLLAHSHFMSWSNRSVAARSGTQSENAEIVSRGMRLLPLMQKESMF